jgi:predicted transcriptional regulator
MATSVIRISIHVVARSEEHLSPARPLADGEAERLAAFAAPSRLKLLYTLIGAELAIEDLATRAELSPNAVSQQLRVLRDLRLVAAPSRTATDA